MVLNSFTWFVWRSV